MNICNTFKCNYVQFLPQASETIIQYFLHLVAFILHQSV